LILLLAGRLFNNDTNGKTGCHTTNLLNAHISLKTNNNSSSNNICTLHIRKID